MLAAQPEERVMNRIETWAAVAAIVGVVIAIHASINSGLDRLHADIVSLQTDVKGINNSLQETKAEIFFIKGVFEGQRTFIVENAGKNPEGQPLVIFRGVWSAAAKKTD